MSSIGALRVALFEDRPYALGETVRGDVMADVEVERQVHDVVVTLFFRARGAEREERQQVTHLVLSGGQWEPGRAVRLPFELVLPSTGPLSTSGGLVVVEWVVEARVRMGNMGDAVAERVLVVDGPTGAPVQVPGAIRWHAPPDWLAHPAVVGMISLLLMSLWTLPANLLAGAFFLVRNGGATVALGALLGVVGALLLVAMAIPVFRLWRRALRIWPTLGARIELSPADAFAADELSVAVDLPKNRERVRHARGALVCAEHAWPGLRRKGGRTHTHARIPFSLARDGGRYVGRVGLPLDAPTSFLGRRHAIEWTVHVDLEMDGLPDRSLERDVTVRGRGTRGGT